ncbi:alginate export family protein [Roseovarius tolerans]|nr:alginate export family protein [Roseovarius tolerans]
MIANTWAEPDTMPRSARITFCLFVAASLIAPKTAASGEILTFEHSLHLDVLHEKNMSLRPSADTRPRDRQDRIAAKLRFSAEFDPDGPLAGFVEFELRRDIDDRQARPRETGTELRLREAYLEVEDVLAPNLDLRIGRWDYEDARRWLIDARLDGIWMRYRGERLEADILAARENQFREDLLDRESRDGDTDYIAGLFRYEINTQIELGAHAIWQQETDGNRDRLRLLGARAQGEALDQLSYWADVSWTETARNGRKQRGRGVDLGGKWQFDHPLKPRLTLGWARGSGNFRQPDLHSNEGSLGQDIETFYYGEVLRPELANLTVLTIGAGMTFDEKLSADVYWRDYRLGNSEHGLRGAALRADPVSGGALGQGVDVVIGYRPAKNIAIDGAFGWFEPGSAFAGTRQGRAFAARLELTWKF